MKGGGSPLPSAVRSEFETSFDTDLGAVRVHDDPSAHQFASHEGARALTIGNDIAFNRNEFDPVSTAGRQLLAHEIAHTVQQTAFGRGSVGSTSHEAEADSAARAVMSGGQARVSQAASIGIQRAPLVSPEDFVRPYFHGVFWDTDGLAAALDDYMVAHPKAFRFITEVIKVIPDGIRDNVGAQFMSLQFGERTLARWAKDPAGAEMFDVLYEEIITGKVTDFERKQATRILAARMIDVDKYVEQSEHLPVFPVRNAGFTRDTYAVFTAKLQANGKVGVHFNSVRAYEPMFREQTDTLSRLGGMQKAMSNIELEPNDIVGVKLYDEPDAPQRTIPAIQLIDYSNQIENNTLGLAATAFFTGLTMGLGGAAVAGTGWVARSVVWADRMAAIIPILDQIANEHREWIEKNVPGGKDLMSALDTANSIAAYYGFARLGMGGLKFLKGRVVAARAARLAGQLPAGLSAAERTMVNELDTQFAKLEAELTDAERLGTEQANAAAAPKPKSAEAPPQSLEVHEGGKQTTPRKTEHLSSLDEAGNAKPRQATKPTRNPPEPPTNPAAPLKTSAANDNALVRAEEQELQLAAGAEDSTVMAQKNKGSAKTSKTPKSTSPRTRQPTRADSVSEHPNIPRSLQNSQLTNDEILAFYRRNRQSYPKNVRELIDDIPLGKPSMSRLEKVDSAIRELHTEEANRMAGYAGAQDQPFVRSVKGAHSSEGAQFSSLVTDQKDLTLIGRLKSGAREVEFDSVQFNQNRIVETKMGLFRTNTMKTFEGVKDTMRKQAEFARDWKFSAVRWEVWEPESLKVAERAYLEILHEEPALGAILEPPVNPSQAF